ncbi:dipeptidase [bacterium]|nr:dipeptidase [bacterium]
MRRLSPLFTALAAALLLTALSGCSRKLTEEAINTRAQEIHANVLVVDTHCDTPMRITRGEFDLGKRHEPLQRASGKMDFPRMKEGGLDAEFFAVFLSQRELTPEAYENAFQLAELTIDSMYAVCDRYSDLAEIALTPDDAYRLEKEGKRAAFLGMENGYALAGDLARVEHFYNRGIRYITLCHTRNNQICDSSTDSTKWGGLSPFGERVVAEMNRLGIMVDVSHIADSSFYDVLKITSAPVIASHSSARALCNHPRNLDDDMLRALKKNGGVIQICILDSYLKEYPEKDAAYDSLEAVWGDYDKITDPAKQAELRRDYYAIRDKYPSTASVIDIVDHIDHVVKTIGIDYVGIGTDFDGGGGVIGCNDVTEFPNITRELVKRGYTEAQIRKIWGGNIMRVFRNVITAAG